MAGSEQAPTKGLVLTGELRNVRVDRIRTNAGQEFDQLQLVVDDGSDYIQKVAVPQNSEQAARALKERIGQTVSIRVFVGQFRKLWFAGLAV